MSGVFWVPSSRPDRVLDIPAEEFGIDMVKGDRCMGSAKDKRSWTRIISDL
jgi:hypothetical protein